MHHDEERPKYEPSKRTLTWKNGSIAQVFSADEPDSLRGPQFDAAWCDELAKWKHAEEAWMNVQMALRLGEVPQAVITTTPRATKLIRELMNDAATVVTRSRTLDNANQLAPSFLKDVMARYGNTALGAAGTGWRIDFVMTLMRCGGGKPLNCTAAKQCRI